MVTHTLCTLVTVAAGRGLFIFVLGILIGLGRSLALSEVVGSMLYGISPTNPVATVGLASLLLVIALLGSAAAVDTW